MPAMITALAAVMALSAKGQRDRREANKDLDPNEQDPNKVGEGVDTGVKPLSDDTEGKSPAKPNEPFDYRACGAASLIPGRSRRGGRAGRRHGRQRRPPGSLLIGSPATAIASISGVIIDAVDMLPECYLEALQSGQSGGGSSGAFYTVAGRWGLSSPWSSSRSP